MKRITLLVLLAIALSFPAYADYNQEIMDEVVQVGIELNCSCVIYSFESDTDQNFYVIQMLDHDQKAEKIDLRENPFTDDLHYFVMEALGGEYTFGYRENSGSIIEGNAFFSWLEEDGYIEKYILHRDPVDIADLGDILKWHNPFYWFGFPIN